MRNREKRHQIDLVEMREKLTSDYEELLALEKEKTRLANEKYQVRCACVNALAAATAASHMCVRVGVCTFSRGVRGV